MPSLHRAVAASAATLCALLIAPLSAGAVVLPVQGALRTSGGGPVADGVYTLTFRLYTAADAEAALWDEVVVGVDVQSGLFHLVLGTNPKSPLDEATFVVNDALWLGAQVSVDPELPRVALLPAPYAVRALVADKLAGPLDGAQIQDASLPAKAVAFTYAGSDGKGGAALDLGCTGCVGLGHLAAGVLAAGNIAWDGTTVADGLDAATDGLAAAALLSGDNKSRLDTLGQAIKTDGVALGVGKAPAGQCSIDIASDGGEVCIDGKPATVVRYADSGAEMDKLGKEGQIVYRNDEKKAYLRVGPAWRQLQLVSVCGDLSVDAPEECDDGNAENGDGCTAKCLKNVCGDGIVHKGVEDCDDGNDDPHDACVACKPATCGDGAVQTGVETCDGVDVGSATCASVLGAGWTGALACAKSCGGYDSGGCKGPIGTENNAAVDCKAIKADQAGASDGVYWLKVGDATTKAWCDMTTSGGGWTLVTSWSFGDLAGDWGVATLGADDPKPGNKHLLPFLSIVPEPTEVRMVYLPNGQALSRALKAGGAWTKGDGKGVRFPATDGNYLVFDEQGAGGYGICLVNGTYSNGFLCDGNSGQVAGVGLFNANAQDELCNCGSFAWKHATGGCSATVCGATGQVAVYLR